MFIPRYWKRVSKEFDSITVNGDRWGWQDNPPALIHAWGYSDTSQNEALERAGRRIDEIVRALAAEHDEGFYYPLRVMREEILQTVPVAGREDALVTRNSYAAQVLNTPDMMFIDIDVPLDDLRRPGVFQRLFGKAAAVEEKNRTEKGRRFGDALRRVETYVAGDREAGFLVYRTFAGFRLIATHKSYDPKSGESEKLLDALGSDPLYRQLCKTQACFRARLTPKYWRMAKRAFIPGEVRGHTYEVMSPGLRFRVTQDMLSGWSDHDEEGLQHYDAWVREYERLHRLHATCHFVSHLGNPEILAGLKPLIEFHDRMTQAGTDLPLA